MAKKDTKLESQGAEFLVLGYLLIQGISCYKSYLNFPGYDLVAINPQSGRIAKIQVKSRWATNYDKSFPIKNFNCDFVVHVALNRGYSFGKQAKENDTGVKLPEIFIFPTAEVKHAQYSKSNWGKTRITKIPDYLNYAENWALIKEFLSTS